MTTLPNPGLNLLGKKIAFSTFVQYAGKALQIAVSAISLKIISNFLSQEGYGIYAAITEYAIFFSTLANLGIFANVVRKMSDHPDDGNIFMNALFLRAITGLFFFALAIITCILNGSSQIFIIGTTLFCGALFFDFLTSVCDGMLQANYLMGRATIALVLGRILNLGVLILIIKHFGSAPSASIDGARQFWVLTATLSGSFLTAVVSLFLVAQRIKLSYQIRLRTMLKFFESSLAFGIIFLVHNLYFRFIPDYLANQSLSNSYFASFNIAFRISQVLSLASTFLMFSALPGLTEYIDGGHKEKARKLYKNLQKLLFGAGLVLVLIGSLIGPYVIALLTHEKYNIPQLWFVLPMMLVLAAISYGYDLVFVTLYSLREDLWFMKREFLMLILSCLFFAVSFLVADMTTKLILILLGAIVGELTMVALGTMKVKNYLN